MLNFDPERYLRIQKGAVALAPILDEVAGTNPRNVFFLGTGGAAILMHPAALLLQRRSSLPVFAEISAELADHASLGPGSLAVIPSVSGTTKESIAALDICKAKGATVLSLVGQAESPLAKNADHAAVNFAEDDTSSESFYIQSLLLALSLMKRRSEGPDYDTILREIAGLPEALFNAKRVFEDEAEAIAGRFAKEPYHIITASGNCWPQAWYYGMCILEEMQWIRTRPVHAADFFHGTFELVEKGVSVLVLKGEDQHRAIAERAEKFAKSHTDKLTVIDTASFALEGLTKETRALVSPAILAALLERLSAHLEVKRNHPLTTRRYYKKVDY